METPAYVTFYHKALFYCSHMEGNVNYVNCQLTRGLGTGIIKYMNLIVHTVIYSTYGSRNLHCICMSFHLQYNVYVYIHIYIYIYISENEDVIDSNPNQFISKKCSRLQL